MLRFDYELVDGARLVSIAGVGPRLMTDGSFYCELIVIRTAEHSIVASVNIDTDEIVVDLDDGDLTLEHDPFLNDFRERLTDIGSVIPIVGKRLGWAWEVQNYRGYNDGLLLSIADPIPTMGLEPTHALIGVASDIKVYWLSRFRPSPEAMPTS